MRDRRPSEHGYALLAAVVFAFVLLVAAMAFFSLVSYETKGALYRQDSSESFYLADGAVERTRAKFLEDRSWRDGWMNQSAGRGDYDLTVTDTTYMGEDAVRLLATGRVGRAERKVEVIADIPPTAFGLTMLVMEDADGNGNLCLGGSAHVNGDADFGPHDVHLQCGGEYTTGFEITPPPIHTDPGHFPGSTYYYVKGHRIGGTYQARIYDRHMNDITTALEDSLVGIVSYNNGQQTYTFEFRNADAETYFDDSTGVFRRNPGDVAAVVNFGETLGNPPDTRSNVIFQASTSVQATIINTRFTGVTEEDRLDHDFWYGGMTELRHITLEPRHGIALITYDFMKPGGALVEIGSAEWPALVYVTNDVETINANFLLEGSFVVLGNWENRGGPDITYNDGFIENLPQYLFEEWPDGVSGTLKILRWRELASTAN